ncbi:hypothetical protein Ancab_024117 [Ancistrocladus abbreviatus]
MREHLLVKLDETEEEAEEIGSRVTAVAAAATGAGRPSDSAVTPVLLLSILVALGGSFICGCAVGYTSPIESAVMDDLGLTTSQFSLFGSMLTIGGLLGSLVSGKITDYIGRKRTMGLADIFCLIGWLAISVSQGVWSLDIGRLLIGFGLGLIVFVVPVYITEIAPKDLRGGSGLLHQFTICCGISTMFFVGLVTSWRILTVIGIIPSLMQFSGTFIIPESPRWLVKVDQDKEFEAALQSLRGDNVDVSLEAADIKDYNEALQKIPKANFLHMFQKRYAYALTVGLGLMALSQLGGTMGIVYYAKDIFESAGFPGSVGTVAMAIIQIPTTAVGVYLMDKAGRRPLLIFSVTGMGLACVFAGLSFFLKDHGLLTHFSPYLVFIGILLYSSTYPLGMGGIPFVMMSEIFPMNIKGSAGSLATLVNWSTSWIISYVFNFMLDWSSAGTFFIFAGVNASSLLFIAKLVPETKGRSLEEIQESFAHILP